jgi:hypothetical protein
VHPAVAVAVVRLAGVPQPVVEHDDGSSGSGELLLAGDVLVAVEPRRPHTPEMAARHEPRAAFSRGDVVRVPEQLDVEGGIGRVGDRVDV